SEQLQAKMYEESGLGNDGSDSTKPQIIAYTGNKDETAVTGGSGGGRYTTTATLSGLSGNFKLGSLPTIFTEDPVTGEATTTQDWKVEPKKLNAPKDDNTHSFTGETLDILTYAGLNPEELGIYYEITSITYYDKDFNTHTIYTNPHASGNAQKPTEAELEELKDALSTIKNAGTYMLTARLIDSNNVKFLVNGVAGTAPSYLAQIDIQKLKLTVTGWTNPSAPKNNTPWEPTYDGNFPAGVVENKITDEKGNEVSEAEWTVGWNKIYYQTLRPTSGNEDNVEIEYAAGVDETVSFDRGDEEGVIYGEIEKPTYTNVSTGTLNSDGVLESTFNGEAQDFTPEGLSALISQNRIKLYAVDEEGNEKEVSMEYFKQKDAGKYKVIARINGNFKWKDSKDKADVIFEFEVQKAQVKAEWDTTGERPVLSIPEGFEEYVEYEYRDEKGNVVAEKNLKKGVSYTVTAKVKATEEKNVEFLFTDLDGNEVIGGSMESGFTVPGGNSLNDLFGLSEDFPLWQLIVICVCLILFIIFMIVTGKHRKEKKEADEETKKYEEDMMLNS
ncbi:MAG: hypothetical protein K2H43_02205, partial [Clostridia bacterium]|nr:hypothetical protein [Clostridia bacterium]